MNSEPNADQRREAIDKANSKTSVASHREMPERKIPQRIFVSEYVCGGAWPKDTLAPSLAREGRAMLTAILADLLRVPGSQVVTTWDRRLGEFPWSEANTDRSESRLEIHKTTPLDEAARFENLCRASDAALIIAPEFDGILANRVATAASLTTLLGPNEEAVSLCSDKLLLARFLEEHQIASVPTAIVNLAEPVSCWEYPVILKPRDGAGSVQTFLVSDSREFVQRCREVSCAGWPTQFIQQPFIPGESISAAAIIEASGRRHILPVAIQLLSENGRFEYIGAKWSRQAAAWQHSVSTIINELLDSVPGLHGYIGLDLIGNADGSVQIVDVNPRLTTGYLVWRMRTPLNLSASILDTAEFDWSSASGEFRLENLESEASL